MDKAPLVITDLRPSALDQARPHSAEPLGREESRNDSRPPFDLLLRHETGLSSVDPNDPRPAEKPGLPDRRTTDRKFSDVAVEREEALEREGDNEVPATKLPSVDRPEVENRPSKPATAARATGSGGKTAPETTAGSVAPRAPADYEPVAGTIPEEMGVTEAAATPLARAVSLAGEAPGTTSAPGDPAAAQPMTADELAARLAVTFASMPTPTTRAPGPATMPNAGSAVGIATASATMISAGATAALTGGFPPGSDSSATVQPQPGEVPAQEADLVLGRLSAASKKEAPFDDPSFRQGPDQDDFNPSQGLPAAARAAVAPASGTVTPERPALPVRPVAEQIALHMARGAKNGLSHLHIALEPDNLGRLEIRLDFHRDGHLNAAIVADRPETLNLLRNEARALEESLKAAGFAASQDNLSFDLSSSNDRSHAFLPEAQARRTFRFGESAAGEDLPVANPVWRPVVSGRLDIRA
jgi:hypothetical protein